VLKAPQEIQVHRGLLDQQVRKAQLEPKEQQGPQDLRVLLDHKVLKEEQVILDHKEQQVTLDHKDSKDYKVHKVRLDRQVPQEPKEMWEQLVRLVRKVLKEMWVL